MGKCREFDPPGLRAGSTPTADNCMCAGYVPGYPAGYYWTRYSRMFEYYDGFRFDTTNETCCERDPYNACLKCPLAGPAPKDCHPMCLETLEHYGNNSCFPSDAVVVVQTEDYGPTPQRIDQLSVGD